MIWNPFRKKHPSSLSTDTVPSADAYLSFIPSQDTRAAIDELSQVVRNNSEAVEIYLALGSLYRSQGEIERAIHIRNNLILRPELQASFKARAYFELGRDFRRAGLLDRATSAFQKSRELGIEHKAVLQEEAKLAAQSGDNAKAARLYEALNFSLAQAHYLVLESKEARYTGDATQSTKKLKQAFRVCPASIEAWLERLICDYEKNDVQALGRTLSTGLSTVDPTLGFVLFEGLIEHCQKNTCEPTPPTVLTDKAFQTLLVSLLSQYADPILAYYGARLLYLCGYASIARTWLENALQQKENFWLARLELFYLSSAEQQVSANFQEHLDFFVDKARNVKRFICTRCGLRRNSLFFLCPRCQNWHSITFQTTIS